MYNKFKREVIILSSIVSALEATSTGFSSFKHVKIERRTLRPDDVAIDIKYTGICHSDIAQVANPNAPHPMVPGHEITGIVSAIGINVKKFKVGDRVGVGCFVNSCGHCKYCLAGEEQFCENGVVSVFVGNDYDGSPSYGGYSQSIIVKEGFVIRIPDNFSLAEAAPMMCAGITTYNPLKRYGIGKGSKVAVVGLGGLGHIAVQFAHSMGAAVTVLGHSSAKRDEAKKFGADQYLILKSDKDFKDYQEHFDFILNTVAVSLNLDLYLSLLKVNGIFCYVGLTPSEQHFNVLQLFDKQRTITASNVGGIKLTQEMIDYAVSHDIHPQIEMIGIDDVPNAYRRILNSDVRYRFVIDMSTLK